MRDVNAAFRESSPASLFGRHAVEPRVLSRSNVETWLRPTSRRSSLSSVSSIIEQSETIRNDAGIFTQRGRPRAFFPSEGCAIRAILMCEPWYRVSRFLRSPFPRFYERERCLFLNLPGPFRPQIWPSHLALRIMNVGGQPAVIVASLLSHASAVYILLYETFFSVFTGVSISHISA